MAPAYLEVKSAWPRWRRDLIDYCIDAASPVHSALGRDL